MLHNEARNLLVEAYEKTHDAKGIALAYGVSVPSVYRLAEQKARTGSVEPFPKKWTKKSEGKRNESSGAERSGGG